MFFEDFCHFSGTSWFCSNRFFGISQEKKKKRTLMRFLAVIASKMSLKKFESYKFNKLKMQDQSYTKNATSLPILVHIIFYEVIPIIFRI